ncbi:MAG: ATP-grasp domain-containing protein, partial [Actinophytocola sp.]|nr:ATP-grasp domain-containing protein [Actinophytocola sp.]
MTTSRVRKLPATDDVELGYYHVSSQLLARAFVANGYPVEWLNKNTFIADVRGHDVGFSVTRGPCVSTFASHVTTRKDFTHTFLARAGLEVANGRAFPADKHARARAYAEKLGWPVVVKPSHGSAGRGITLEVRAETFEDAWASATERDGSVMVESYFPGAEARFVVVGDRCVAAAGKRPPSVVGDGTSTLAELVEAKNALRRSNPLYEKRPIKLTEARIEALARRGFPLDHVLATNV